MNDILSYLSLILGNYCNIKNNKTVLEIRKANLVSYVCDVASCHWIIRRYCY